MIAPTSKREAYRGVVESSVFVDEDYLRKGIGTKLLAKLCEETEKYGYWTLYSAIFSVNIASIELHKKCGFRVIGYREKIAKDRFGNWQSTTIMERRNGIM
jgi:phosphinothricin acetyltransferase